MDLKIYSTSQDDLKAIALLYKELKNFRILFTPDESSLFNVLFTGEFRAIGDTCFGGQDQFNTWVSVMHKGAFHFNFKDPYPMTAEYVSEKLNLSLLGAHEFAKVLNAIKEYDNE